MDCAPTKPNGRVSIVIPTYNRAHLLAQAIDSALRQTAAGRCDVVVVDDGSTDETAKVAARYGSRIEYIWQGNGGLAAARNTGISALGNEFAAFLDDDDEWTPDKTERQIAVMERWPEVVFVAGRALRRFADGRTLPHPDPPVPFNEPTDFAPLLMARSCLVVPMLLVRRQYLEQTGLFCERLRRVEDYHMWTRLACRGPCVYMDVPVTTYAVETPGALTRDEEGMRQGELAARRLLRRELRWRPDCRDVWRRGIADHLRMMRDRAYRDRRYLASARYGIESLWYWPRERERWEWGKPLRALWRAVVPSPAVPD
ncbi:MAG: glycosyltransferase family A protein [Phycisphaerae bacterium]|jgi:glycosyltransferase involved in cell wall biosynthesis